MGDVQRREVRAASAAAGRRSPASAPARSGRCARGRRRTRPAPRRRAPSRKPGSSASARKRCASRPRSDEVATTASNSAIASLEAAKRRSPSSDVIGAGRRADAIPRPREPPARPAAGPRRRNCGGARDGTEVRRACGAARGRRRGRRRPWTPIIVEGGRPYNLVGETPALRRRCSDSWSGASRPPGRAAKPTPPDRGAADLHRIGRHRVRPAAGRRLRQEGPVCRGARAEGLPGLGRGQVTSTSTRSSATRARPSPSPFSWTRRGA